MIVWEAGRTFTRAHSHEFGSTEFDARVDSDARFSPLLIDGEVVPVIYAGGDDRTAAAETIFHRLPGCGRPRRIWLDQYRAWHWSEVTATRDLFLLRIDAARPTASVLVDGDATTYGQSRQGAAALLAHYPHADGLIWASRQLHEHPSTMTIDIAAPDVCLLIVGPHSARAAGVNRQDLESDVPVVPFVSVQGTERLDRIADELDVTVIRS